MTRKTQPAAAKALPKAAAKRKTAPKAKATAKPKTVKAAPANRTGSGQFKKGQSGNPSGRPKEIEEVRNLARAHTTAAINRLVQLMADDSGRVAVAACQALLDRGWGKPTQPLANDGERPLVPMLNVSYG